MRTESHAHIVMVIARVSTIPPEYICEPAPHSPFAHIWLGGAARPAAVRVLRTVVKHTREKAASAMIVRVVFCAYVPDGREKVGSGAIVHVSKERT